MGRTAVAAALALLLAGEAAAQFSTTLRSGLRVSEQTLREQVRRALRPTLSVRGIYAGPPRAMTLAVDGARMAVITEDGGLRLHDLAAGVEVTRLPPEEGGYVAMAVAPGEVRYAALTAEGTLRLSETPAGLAEGRVALSGAPASAIAFADGALLVGHRDGALSRVDPATRDVETLGGPTGATATALHALASGGAVLVGHADGRLRLLVAGGPAQEVLREGAGITALRPLGDGGIAAGVANGRVVVLSPGGTEVRADWQAHERGPLALDARGEAIATGSRTGGAILWTADGVRRAELSAPGAGPVTAVGLAAPGQGLRAFVAGPDTAVVLTAAEGAPLATYYPTRRGWGAVDGEGRFDGDETAFDDLAWSAGRLRLEVERYGEGWFEPGLLYKHLLGTGRFLTDPAFSVESGLPEPPEARLTVEAAADAPGAPIRLTVEASAAAPLPVEEIRLYQNGKRVPPETIASDAEDRSGDRLTRRMSFSVPAVPGENRFRAVARDGAGIDSAPRETTLRVAGGAGPGRLHVTAIGINRYANPRWDLNYAVADARGFARVLSERGQGVFLSIERELLLDGAATEDRIRASLDRLRDTEPNDAAVLFMAGHAQTIPDGWYFPGHELLRLDDARHVAEVGISAEALVAALMRVPARRILLVIDACFSGAVLGPFERFAQRRAFHQIKQRTGVTVIAATREDQLAPEFPQLGHGVTTAILIDGLGRGENGRLRADTDPADGNVTARELRGYVERTVPPVAQTLSQTLGTRGVQGGSVPVTPVGLSWGENFQLAR